MPGNIGRFDAGSHLPITRAQEIILPSMAEPWIETFPMYEPRPAWDFPPMPEDISPLPFEAPYPYSPSRPSGGGKRPRKRDRDCEKERAEAFDFCDRHIKDLKAGLEVGNFGGTLEQCMMGQISERCGGNPIQWGKWKPPQA
jgi:hypothetical protein